MKKIRYCSFAVLGSLIASNILAADKPATAPEVVKVDDISRIVVDKDAQVDVKKLLAQFEAMLSANANKISVAEANNLKLSMVQAKVAEHVLAVAARKVNLQNDAQVKEQLETLTRQILVRAYIAKVMKDRIKPEDVQKAYEKYKADNATPKPGIVVGNILVATEEEAKNVMKLLDNGEKFEDVAKKHSMATSKENGGREDVVPLDALPPQMEGLKGLEVGQHLKEPFKSPAGYHIVAVLGKQNVEALPFEKVQRVLESDLFRAELEKLINTTIKTINVKAYNDKGMEVNAQKLLTEPVDLKQPAAASVKSPVQAAPAATPAPAVEKPAAVEKKNDKIEQTDSVTQEEQPKEETAFQKGIKWVKSLF